MGPERQKYYGHRKWEGAGRWIPYSLGPEHWKYWGKLGRGRKTDISQLGGGSEHLKVEKQGTVKIWIFYCEGLENENIRGAK